MFAPRNMLGRRTPVAVVRPRVAPVAQSDNSPEERFSKSWDEALCYQIIQNNANETTSIENVWGRLIEV